MPEERLQAIESLIEECGFATRKEFFDNAVSLLNWAVRRSREGSSIASVNERDNIWRELQMPFLERIREANSDERGGVVHKAPPITEKVRNLS
jgi:hypothetical protein